LTKGKPRVVQVVGAHESGKTTLVVALIRGLADAGFAVASVKETHHEYPTDLPGKDSERHAAAGANPALLVAGRRTARHRIEPAPPELEMLLARDMAEADVVVVEGYRRARYPKVEVVRAATGREPVAEDDETVVAVVTDRQTRHPASVPRLPLTSLEEAVGFVKALLA
jgi:molybdopterin-guanine dinucleotide biosynthesis protein B